MLTEIRTPHGSFIQPAGALICEYGLQRVNKELLPIEATSWPVSCEQLCLSKRVGLVKAVGRAASAAAAEKSNFILHNNSQVTNKPIDVQCPLK